MTSRALRVALATMAIAAIVGAAYVTWKALAEGDLATDAARIVDARVRSASRTLLEIKSAQAGYVAAGQGDDFWTARVDALFASSRETMAALRSQAGAAAQPEIDAALAAVEDFEQMDRRARDYARNGQRLLASDLIFSEGIEKLDAAVGALDRARDLDDAAHSASVQEARRRQLLAAASAAAAALLVVLLLTPVKRGTTTVEPAALQAPDASPDLPLSLRRESPAAVIPQAAPPSPPPSVRVEASPPPAAPAIDLPAIASLCTDLGRVLDTRALPDALERATRLLDASGIVLWIADPDGRELAPVMAHGYPQNMVARMGAIPRDAENVTAAAFRTGVVQTVRADAISHGAIAAPLMTATGPVGVMAAEVLHDGERHEATRAAAAIIAAQLATLMGPPSSRAQTQTGAAGA